MSTKVQILQTEGSKGCFKPSQEIFQLKLKVVVADCIGYLLLGVCYQNTGHAQFGRLCFSV